MTGSENIRLRCLELALGREDDTGAALILAGRFIDLVERRGDPRVEIRALPENELHGAAIPAGAPGAGAHQGNLRAGAVPPGRGGGDEDPPAAPDARRPPPAGSAAGIGSAKIADAGTGPHPDGGGSPVPSPSGAGHLSPVLTDALRAMADLARIAGKEWIKSAALADALAVEPRMASNRLFRLKEAGLVEMRGVRRAAEWRLTRRKGTPETPPARVPPPAGRLSPAAGAAAGRREICTWIDGDPRDRSATRCGDLALPGKPYCQAHAARAYRRPPGAEDAA